MQTLGGKFIYIYEDFRKETMEIRKELFSQAKELRKEGKFEKVIHNRFNFI